MKGKGIIYGVLIVVGGIVSYFTVSGKDAAKWNDRTVVLIKKFPTAWKTFDPNFSPYLEGQAIDGPKLDAAMVRYEGEVKTAAAGMRKETPPDDLDCRELHSALVAFADLQEAQVGQIKKMVVQMKAVNPGQAADIARMSAELETMAKSETAAEAHLVAAQKKMAAKFKLKLK